RIRSSDPSAPAHVTVSVSAAAAAVSPCDALYCVMSHDSVSARAPDATARAAAAKAARQALGIVVRIRSLLVGRPFQRRRGEAESLALYTLTTAAGSHTTRRRTLPAARARPPALRRAAAPPPSRSGRRARALCRARRPSW